MQAIFFKEKKWLLGVQLNKEMFLLFCRQLSEKIDGIHFLQDRRTKRQSRLFLVSCNKSGMLREKIDALFSLLDLAELSPLTECVYLPSGEMFFICISVHFNTTQQSVRLGAITG